jgi:8-oxo-dGTP pyrophosphatase MutT (NUDIX family)
MRLREYSAAGGVVLDAAGRVLLLERWLERESQVMHEVRLPKGHVEPGETDEQAALRETCEESGYCELEILADLGTALTEFTNPSEHVSRLEHFYLMRLAGQPRREPNYQGPDEALFHILWVANFDEAESRLTYEPEKKFVRRARLVPVPPQRPLEAG